MGNLLSVKQSWINKKTHKDKFAKSGVENLIKNLCDVYSLHFSDDEVALSIPRTVFTYSKSSFPIPPVKNITAK